jgi:hypothetical protein
MDSSAKDRFDACMKAADFGAARWDARRQYEWKITLGFWALLVAAIAFFRETVLPLWAGPVALFLYGFWLRSVWLANDADKEFSDFFRLAAEKILSDDNICKPPPKYQRIRWIDRVKARPRLKYSIVFLVDWAVAFQFVTSVLLVLLLYIFYWKKAVPFY